MPDSAIGELPLAEYIDDNDKIPMEQGGVAMHITGEQLKAFIDRNILGVRTQTLPEGSDVTGSYNAETGILTLGIPRSLGAANSVDGVSAGTSGDVPLCAVSYDRGQNLTDAQKARARANLGLTSIVKVSTFISDTVEIPVGTRNVARITCNENGYIPLGILGVEKRGTGAAQCLILEYFFADTTPPNARVYLRNDGGADALVSVEIWVLMAKEEIL